MTKSQSDETQVGDATLAPPQPSGDINPTPDQLGRKP
jgi:hypothetical protein